MFVMFNPNPNNKKRVGDCVIRAISKALEMSWEDAYIQLCIQGYIVGDLPSSNHTWDVFLKAKGFVKDVVPNDCPGCYTIEDFCKDHPQGTYVLGTGSHAVAVIDGDYYDTWDSGNESPIYFYYKGE